MASTVLAAITRAAARTGGGKAAEGRGMLLPLEMGRAKVQRLPPATRLPTSTSTLYISTGPPTASRLYPSHGTALRMRIPKIGAAKLLPQHKWYGAIAIAKPPPAPFQQRQQQGRQQQQQPRAVATTTDTTSGMGDENQPRRAATAANVVTSWEKSKPPLPKLPVPDLSSTMGKYLTVLATVLNSEEMDVTRYNVQEFIKKGGVGEKLQFHLARREADLDNWVYDYWLDDMYLKIRLPLPINSNPGMVFPKETFSGAQQQLSYASRFIHGLLDYKKMIDTGNIPVEKARFPKKEQLMCMEQHYRMFSSYRRPGIPKDEQLTTLGKGVPPYCIVACRGQFYKLDLEVNGCPLTVRETYSQLSKIVAATESDSSGFAPIGLLTAFNRNRWAEVRERLVQAQVNEENLDTIENCLFILCLDKPTVPIPRPCAPEDKVAEELISKALHMLHGQGTMNNTRNRWFDKTLQFIVAEDGSCGMNYEHSVGEGLAPIQIVNHALSYMSMEAVIDALQMAGERCLPEPTRLVWAVSSDTLSDIEDAKTEIDSLIDNLDMWILKFEMYGRDFPKSQGISPDGYIQLALQLTYYKLHGKLVMTYESAGLRRFRRGRVDNIRANSPPALQWIRAMVGEFGATIQEKYMLFKQAAAWQQEYTLDTVAQGKGIDCHLLGLRETAKELGLLESIPLFTDPSFAKAHHFTLSTSQVTTGNDSFMLYGPVVPDGYGACYNPAPDYIIVCVTSFRECIETSSRMFACTLESTFLQMRELCLQGSQPAPEPKPEPEPEPESEPEPKPASS